MFNKKKETVIKDYGQITIPESWEEVTLKQFQKITENQDKGTSDISTLLSILTEKERDEINQYPAEIVESLLARLVFLNEDPRYGQSSNKIKIGKETYLINYLEKLKFGEYVDVNTVIEKDKYNYSACLAILCRKDGELYDDDFIANKLDDRIKMFEELSVVEVMPLITFFLQLYNSSQQCSQTFIQDAKETLNQLATAIEDSVKNGRSKRFYSISQMIQLRKLKKYRKLIAQLS